MTRGAKIGLTVGGIMVVLPIFGIAVLLAGMSWFAEAQTVRREMPLPNHGSLIIDGKKTGRSEHGFSQSAGYRPPGSTEIEWFGDVSDGVEPQVYLAGPLLVVIDLPAAQLYVRTQVADFGTGKEQDAVGGRGTLPSAVRQPVKANWKNLALIFPDDLGPFPISFYAEKNGLTTEEVTRINELGGKRERKYPTTYIQSFDPETRDLKCSYHVDNTSSWPLNLRLSEDGTRLTLVEIGGKSP
jgi:hypothetical protein